MRKQDSETEFHKQEKKEKKLLKYNLDTFSNFNSNMMKPSCQSNNTLKFMKCVCG